MSDEESYHSSEEENIDNTSFPILNLNDDDEKSEEEEENSLFGPDEETETETDKDYILPKNLTIF